MDYSVYDFSYERQPFTKLEHFKEGMVKKINEFCICCGNSRLVKIDSKTKIWKDKELLTDKERLFFLVSLVEKSKNNKTSVSLGEISGAGRSMEKNNQPFVIMAEIVFH